MTLTHFMPLIYFYTPWKYQTTSRFLIFSGGIKRDQRNEMGLENRLPILLHLNDGSSPRRCSKKKLFLKILQYSQENICLQACNFIKKRLYHKCFPVPQVFSCEYCEVFKNTCFEEHLRTAASEMSHLLHSYCRPYKFVDGWNSNNQYYHDRLFKFYVTDYI